MRFAVMLLLSFTLLHATTLYGEILSGEDFETLDNTVIKISGPKTTQFIASGNYSIELPPDTYEVTAQHYEKGILKLYSKDSIALEGEGVKYDIILLPTEFQAVQALEDLGDVDVPSPPKQANAEVPPPAQNYMESAIMVTLSLAAILLFRFYWQKKNEERAQMKAGEEEEKERKEIDEDAMKVLKVIGENEGRIRQRELREIVNFSETKMSLVVAELEALGLVKRIKKGRENIIKLKK